MNKIDAYLSFGDDSFVMALVIIIAILMLLESYVGIEMVNSPPTKNLHKWIYRCSFGIIGIAVIVLTGFQYRDTEKQDDENHSIISGLTNQVGNLNQNNATLVGQVFDMKTDIQGLIMEFSTNSGVEPIIRLAVLNDESEKLDEKIKGLQSPHEVFSVTNMTLQSLRDERTYQISNQNVLLQYQKQQALVQQQIASLQAQQQARQDEAQQEKQAEREKQFENEQEKIFSSQESAFAGQAIPIFDYAINKFSGMLNGLAGQAGIQLRSTFPGQNPTIYNSDMVSNGVIVNGENSLRIGTNSIWDFKISISDASPYGPNSDANFAGGPYRVALNIVCEGTNGESSLTIKPPSIFTFIYASGRRRDGFVSPVPFSTVSITLNVPNGLNIDKTVSSTNYYTDIDEALRRLIEAQDQESPLK